MSLINELIRKAFDPHQQSDRDRRVELVILDELRERPSVPPESLACRVECPRVDDFPCFGECKLRLRLEDVRATYAVPQRFIAGIGYSDLIERIHDHVNIGDDDA